MVGDQFLKSAFSYLFIGDYRRAAEAFQQAMDADPLNPVFAFHGSVTALRNGDLELAERWAVRALANDPNHPIYLHHLQRIRSRRDLQAAHDAIAAGDIETAKSLLESAVSRDPLNDTAEDLLNQQIQTTDGVEHT